MLQSLEADESRIWVVECFCLRFRLWGLRLRVCLDPKEGSGPRVGWLDAALVPET